MCLEDIPFVLVDLDALSYYDFLQNVEPQMDVAKLTTQDWLNAIQACLYRALPVDDFYGRWRCALDQLRGFLSLWVSQGDRLGGRLREHVRRTFTISQRHLMEAQSANDVLWTAVMNQLRDCILEWKNLEPSFEALLSDVTQRQTTRRAVDLMFDKFLTQEQTLAQFPEVDVQYFQQDFDRKCRWMMDVPFRDVTMTSACKIYDLVALRPRPP